MQIIDQIYFQSPWLRDHTVIPRETSFYKRDLFEPFFAQITQTKQIVSLTGMRRVGKSTLLKQCIGKLLQKRVQPSRIMYFAFDQPTVLHHLDTLEQTISIFLEQILNTSVSQLDETVYCFFDEVQLIPYWQDVLKRWYDVNPKLKFIISGSSSLFLITKSKESLAGRIFEFFLPPLTFHEYTQFSKNTDILSYLDYGQFPELLELDASERKKEYLKEIVTKVLEVDVLSLYGVRKAADFERLFWTLLPNTGQIIKSSSLTAEIGLKKATFFHYLKILEGTLLIHKVLNLQGSFRSESRLLRKLYPGSTNFLTLNPETISSGFKAEAYVSTILSTYGTLYFYRKREKEIDFIIPEKKMAIEVKYQEHIHPRDYSFLMQYAAQKAYTPLVITKSAIHKKPSTPPYFIPLQTLEQEIIQFV